LQNDFLCLPFTHRKIEQSFIMAGILSKILNLFLPKAPEPYCSDNTFFVWEPCTYSHAEVVPGFVKYLLDLSYEVSVLVTPARYDEGLFQKFGDFNGRLHLNKLTQKQIRKFFKNNGLKNAKGIMLTTSGKLAEPADYPTERKFFGELKNGQKLIIVEHDIKKAVDTNTITNDIVMLRKAYYKDATITEINPHYFGDVTITQKNKDITNFITVGALRGKRRNTDMLVDAVKTLVANGKTNFKITCIGKGSIKNIPAELRKYFDAKGEASFAKLYDEMEKADFFLPLLDSENPAHDRYITTGTSGSFQLIYGFATPCVIEQKFAQRNYFDTNNAILYTSSKDLAQAMQQAIDISQEQYATLQQNLSNTANNIAKNSLDNLRKLL